MYREPNLNRQLQPLSIALVIICIVIGANSSGQAWAQENDSRQIEQASGLEARLKNLQERFDDLGRRLERATGQAAGDIKSEFDDVAQELADVLAERRAAYQRQAADVKSSLDTAWKKFAAQSAQSREMTAREIESIRSRWNMAFMNLQKAHFEHVNYIQKELTRLENDIAKSSNELNYEVTAKREAVRLAYETRARQMRDSYQAYIQALQNEVQRITTAAENASSENRVRMMKKVDEINTKSNAAYEKVHHNFDRMASKARAYLQSNRERLEKADDDVKEKIESEMDAITSDVTRLRAETIESMEAYRESLNQQAAALAKRASDGGAEVTAMAAKLEARRKMAETQLAEAYQSYAASIRNEVKRLEQKLEQVDDGAHSEIADAIEALQRELSRIEGK